MTDREEVDKQSFHLQDFRAGSPQAFRIFFFKYFAEFFSFARLLVRDKEPAKNVTVVTLFLLWAKHGDFDSEKNLKAFLYTTIRDSCLQYLKHLQKNPDALEYTPGATQDARSLGLLPDEMRQELQAYADHFAPRQ